MSRRRGLWPMIHICYASYWNIWFQNHPSRSCRKRWNSATTYMLHNRSQNHPRSCRKKWNSATTCMVHRRIHHPQHQGNEEEYWYHSSNLVLSVMMDGDCAEESLTSHIWVTDKTELLRHGIAVTVITTSYFDGNIITVFFVNTILE